MGNINLFFQIYGLGHKSAILDKLMVFGAEYLIFLTLLFTILLAVKGSAKEKKVIFLSVVGLAVAEAVITLIRIFYKEPRPFITYPELQTLVKHGKDLAFPSTHTTIMSVITSAYYFYKSKWAPLFLILTLWVGFSRIFVGVHYPLDIIGGLATGLVAVSITWQLKNWLRKKLTGL